MTRKTLIAMGLAGVLVIPAGAALAATDDSLVELPAQVLLQDQAQQQDRVQDPTECGACRRLAGEEVQGAAVAGDQARIRERMQDSTECDGEGVQLRQQLHSQTQAAAGAGLGGGAGAAYGAGPQDGTGPIHEGPADGTGNRYGAGGR